MYILTESTFIVYAMNCYDNPSCHDVAEFEEDMKRFQYLRKLFNRYIQFNDLRERLILNHLIVLYNMFGRRTTNMLYLKMEGQHVCLKPFIDYLNNTTEYIEYNNKKIKSSSINGDLFVTEMLNRI
jgi:hypothetical protein